MANGTTVEQYRSQLAAARKRLASARSQAERMSTTPTFTQRQLRVGQRGYLTPRQRAVVTKRQRPLLLQRKSETLAHVSQAEAQISQAAKEFEDYLAQPTGYSYARRGRRARPKYKSLDAPEKGFYGTAVSYKGKGYGVAEQFLGGPKLEYHFSPTVIGILRRGAALSTTSLGKSLYKQKLSKTKLTKFKSLKLKPKSLKSKTKAVLVKALKHRARVKAYKKSLKRKVGRRLVRAFKRRRRRRSRTRRRSR